MKRIYSNIIIAILILVAMPLSYYAYDINQHDTFLINHTYNNTGLSKYRGVNLPTTNYPLKKPQELNSLQLTNSSNDFNQRINIIEKIYNRTSNGTYEEYMTIKITQLKNQQEYYMDTLTNNTTKDNVNHYKTKLSDAKTDINMFFNNHPQLKSNMDNLDINTYND